MAKPKPIECLINYYDSDHLSQIYDGFERLHKQGVINLKYQKESDRTINAILKVIINGKKVIYDNLDGNLSEELPKEELNYFLKNYSDANYYFKRSFDEDLIKHLTENCIANPLGLNYQIEYSGDIIPNKHLSFFYKISHFKKERFPLEYFEQKPKFHSDNKILFYTRLWNPENFTDKLAVKKYNEMRINAIRTCKNKFGNNFIGGVYTDKYSITQCKDILVSRKESSKENFLKNVKKANICIATTGLHKSIGWKFAEYIAASRAIISEPLNFTPSGNLKSEKNYSTFTDENELISKIETLINDPKKTKEMMHENHKYYNQYLRSDKLILNTINIVEKAH